MLNNEKTLLNKILNEFYCFYVFRDVKEYILEYWTKHTPHSCKPFEISDIVIDEDLHNDDRIGWRNVHHVCVKRLGNEDYMKEYGYPQCIGMCSEDYHKNYMEVFEKWAARQK